MFEQRKWMVISVSEQGTFILCFHTLKLDEPPDIAIYSCLYDSDFE